MLARLQAIGRGASGQTKGSDAHEEPRAASRPPSAEDSVLLLIPTDGGMAFRLFAVESEQAAAAFVFQEYPQLAAKSLTFQPRAAPPGRYAGDDAEALVLVADDARPGMVFVSSFEDPEAAQSFLQFEEKNGLDMNLVTTYWGVPKAVAVADSTPVANATAMPVTPTARAVPPVHPGTVRRAKPAAGTPATGRASAADPAEQEGVIDAIRSWPGWPTLTARIAAVSVLNDEVHEVIRKDPIASSQARVIVAATAAAAGIGVFWFGPLAVIVYAVLSVAGWFACARLTYWMGTKLFPGKRSPESQEWLFKSLAFAQAPRALLVFGLALPGFGLLLALATFVWTLAASVAAVEETLEIDTQSALLAAMTGWLAMFAIAQALPLTII
jgi:Yip1 domain